MPIPAIVAAPAIGAAIGKVFDIGSGKRQLKQQAKLQALQIQGQKEMADYNMQKELQMWKDTNYQAQMEQLKMAGLNPGLIYGMSGGGGQTTGNPQASVTGATAPTDTHMSQMLMSGLQMGILKAQKENIEATTAKTQAETANLPIAAKQMEASTASMLQGINNQKAQEELTKAQTAGQALQNQYDQATLNDKINLINTTTEHAKSALHIIKNDADISDQTKETQIKQVTANWFLTLAQTRLTNAQRQLTDQQLQTEKAKLEQIAAQIVQGQRQLDINKMNAETLRTKQYDEQVGEEDPLGDVLEQVGIILPIPGGKMPTPIKGFHKR